jgi:4-hydroxy-3-methylbut-2-enyl diphosphate reductase
MQVIIDKSSGYCFGVEFAIQMAEDELNGSGGHLFCLGDIVHNDMEVQRLHDKGLRIINREQLKDLRNCKVLIRAHGEPPETYELALKNNIELIDASCPVVLKLQNRIKNAWDKTCVEDGQIVIYGQPGHAEVVGLTGQTNENAIIITTEEDLQKIDFNKPVVLFSQTTKSTQGFYNIRALIEERLKANGIDLDEYFQANDSICRQVSNREPRLREFAAENDVLLFVSGKKSSNGKALFNACKEENEKSFFIENQSEIEADWFQGVQSVGICGATSTPMWLMEQVAAYVSNIEQEILS